jgi:hypothetical protein
VDEEKKRGVGFEGLADFIVSDPPSLFDMVNVTFSGGRSDHFLRCFPHTSVPGRRSILAFVRFGPWGY